MSQAQEVQLQSQELTVSQILHDYEKKFSQITERYSDGLNGRCAIGVLMRSVESDTKLEYLSSVRIDDLYNVTTTNSWNRFSKKDISYIVNIAPSILYDLFMFGTIVCNDFRIPNHIL